MLDPVALQLLSFVMNVDDVHCWKLARIVQPEHTMGVDLRQRAQHVWAHTELLLEQVVNTLAAHAEVEPTKLEVAQAPATLSAARVQAAPLGNTSLAAAQAPATLRAARVLAAPLGNTSLAAAQAPPIHSAARVLPVLLGIM
jgi:hypothetical protein